ncbi:ornithine cyclodeaminase family protein [Tuwongella immobilis]|uniref:Ornithine cyclodeaminase n=1 Tax=Tuwongella immobilis TaxID=692036 RepID=A0A6C2YJT2_9BACT|nr:ornithine cyclodeaminase family protein [Tuwongella immobilis]VIP01212.1 Ornithine cyclodeaminase OS=uncultured planctomycete GN=HGMM_F11G08C23 PE=4 SV=1: OCD_Mu_crystall [Tuwongella immobilis]VTR97850.1 Ornithine cyclodeaminase OS=uncultured planctomycete GN=HGMM_F11G08C23 PE=4 SV=1: OCD_Mu_crystall [Tuwongella immobilis]
MSVLYLSEDDVRQVLTMELALESVEAGIRKVALSEGQSIPRTRCQTDHVMLHVMSASAKSLGVIGLKTYTTTRKQSKFLVLLYDGRSGELKAMMQADYLGQMRTGAASGLATRLLAPESADTVGILGAGKQARTQLQAVCQVRSIRQARVYSPTAERRTQFAAEMSALCGVEVIPVDTPEAAVRDMAIVCTASSARDPILFGNWLHPGQHLNIVGSNFLGKSEIDLEVCRRSKVVVVDNEDQAKLEAGDFVEALREGVLDWREIQDLGHVLVGRAAGRKTPEDITLFKSVGVAIEDVALAGRLLPLAQDRGLGTVLPI